MVSFLLSILYVCGEREGGIRFECEKDKEVWKKSYNYTSYFGGVRIV